MKRSRAQVSEEASYLDFHPLQKPNFTPPEICVQSGAIASNLLRVDSFFQGTFVEVLREIAKENGLPEPNQTMINSIRDNLRCEVFRTQDPEVYMQCSTEEAKIFINETVVVHTKDIFVCPSS